MDTIYNFKVITLTHKNTHLNEIGLFVLGEGESDTGLKSKLEELKHQLGIREIMYLATCNRVLFFFTSDENVDGSSFVKKFFEKAYPHLSLEHIRKAVISALIFEGKEAISHLFEVAASMDSMVVGEREILRQLRETYDKNNEMGLTSDSIRIAMRFAVEAAKKVYTSTGIGEKHVSIVSLAIQKMLNKQLTKEARFLLIGAGQTNRLVAKFLTKHGYNNIVIFNRSLKSAQQLASDFNGQALPLSDLACFKGGFDVVFAATHSTEIILTKELYTSLTAEDKNSKLLIDLSIPANIDASVSDQFNAEYVPIESLRELAQENLSYRENELVKAKLIIDEYVDNFNLAFRERQIELALREVPEQIKAIRSHAVNNVFKNEISELDDHTRELLDKVLSYMEKRCIAIPIQVAKEKLAHS